MVKNTPVRVVDQSWARGAKIGLSLVITGLVLGLLLTWIGPGSTFEGLVSESLLTKPYLPLVGVGIWVSRIFGVLWASVIVAGLAAITAFWNRRAAVWIIVTPLLAWFPCMVLKYLYQRPRPAYLGLPTFVTDFTTDAFPSGHTAFAVGLVSAFVVVLVRSGRPWWPAVVLGVPVVLLVAISVVVVGRHWVGDTIGSMILAPGFVLSLYPLVLRFWPWLAEDVSTAETPPRRLGLPRFVGWRARNHETIGEEPKPRNTIPAVGNP